jgi:hypothetical protein
MRYSELFGQILQAVVERLGVMAKPAQASLPSGPQAVAAE